MQRSLNYDSNKDLSPKSFGRDAPFRVQVFLQSLSILEICNVVRYKIQHQCDTE